MTSVFKALNDHIVMTMSIIGVNSISFNFCMTFYSHVPIGKVWIYRLLLAFLFVCTVTDFSGDDKAIAASNFARWFRGVLGRESPILGNFASPEAQNRTNRRAASSIADRHQSPSLTARSPSVKGTGVYRQYLPSACVDIRQSPKTDVMSCIGLFYDRFYACLNVLK